MKKELKNTLVQETSIRPVERKLILESVIASFRMEGIFIPESRIQAIYTRVNQKLKK